uniref:Uncharacterized protein n=1 Tax=Tanacetum cinerariifolium TaxID=118510 RepID=A0A699IFD8_TANCI|nr:hypothetical protein [Tanacetum cinerariifolium]
MVLMDKKLQEVWIDKKLSNVVLDELIHIEETEMVKMVVETMNCYELDLHGVLVVQDTHEADQSYTHLRIEVSHSALYARSDQEVYSDAQSVDEAFMMVNYSRLESLIRRRMRELRLQGVATHLNYSIEDVDEERKMKAPPEFQSQPFKETEGQAMQGIPPLLAAHLRKTERKRRTLSPREALVVYRIPANRAPY